MNCKNNKSSIVLCTLVIFLFLKINIFSQPVCIPPTSGSSNYLFSIYTAGISPGYLTGDLGNLSSSANRGTNGNSMNISPNVLLTGVFLKDINKSLSISSEGTIFSINTPRGYAAGGNAFILRTANGNNKDFDTSTAKYYPLAIGNTWVYKDWYLHQGEYLPIGYIRCNIIKDTVFNGHKYYIFDISPSVCGSHHQFERVDSSTLNVYRINPRNWEEELYDSLLSSVSNTFSGSRNCENNMPVLCADTSTIVLFGSLTKSVKFIQDGPLYCGYTLGTGVGFVSYLCADGNTWGRELQGCIINGIMYGDTTIYFTISGHVTYSDNHQPVHSGYVKALKYDNENDKVIIVDSAIIKDGNYILPHVPKDSMDIMAYADDEELDFVPTYHDSTIFWREASLVYPSSNLTNVNLRVFRLSNSGSQYSIGGSVFSANHSSSNALENAIIYTKSGNSFKNYAISSATGSFSMDSLSMGNFELIVDRMGYCSDWRIVNLYCNMSNVNFYLKKFAGISNPGLQLLKDYILEQNYPNPFNPMTSIRFSIPKITNVKIQIYDVLGRLITTLVNRQLKPGSYKTEWDASSCSNGVYFYKLITDDFTETKKMMLIK
jgi:hypothetical protein